MVRLGCIRIQIKNCFFCTSFLDEINKIFTIAKCSNLLFAQCNPNSQFHPG